jgi:hypothetical protein
MQDIPSADGVDRENQTVPKTLGLWQRLPNWVAIMLLAIAAWIPVVVFVLVLLRLL